MENFYVACELGEERSRVLLGNLRQGRLTISEAHHFQNPPAEEADARFWNIPQMYGEILTGLREIGSYEEAVSSVSCHSWGGDFMVFDPDGSLSKPVGRQLDSKLEAGMEEVIAKIPWEMIYDETGVSRRPGNTLFQLSAEKSRRLKSAGHFLPMADGFNYILSGTPRVEMSLAGTTQLFNPLARTWSERLLTAARLPAKIFPPVVPAGSRLGALREPIAKEAKLDNVQVIASCSHELAATLAGLPVGAAESWGFIRHGSQTLMGTEISEPIIAEVSRELRFSNEIGSAGAVGFHKQIMGFWILEECERFWKAQDREIDRNVLIHFAGSSQPFESLVDLTDSRFHTPGDMPLKIQEFCRETNQTVPRKPGHITRCILESLAFLYRKTLSEIEVLAGRKITKLFVLDGQQNSVLNHFTANALQLPLVIVPPGSSAAGNLMVQAMAQGHVTTLEEARGILSNSIKTKTILPHTQVWDEAYARLTDLVPA